MSAARANTPPDTAFVQALLAADAHDRLVGLPEPIRGSLVAMQVRAQGAHLASAWPEAEDRMLLDEHGRPAGRLLVGRSPGGLHVVDLRVHAGSRGAGIATGALGELLAEADALGADVHLHVDPNSPARRLYERLGFRCTGPVVGAADVPMLRPAVG